MPSFDSRFKGATILQERWEAVLVKFSPKWVMYILGYCTQKKRKEKKIEIAVCWKLHYINSDIGGI